ncbi:MAG TPA: acetylornithine/succinylornithine family transaminase [Gaiellaceae bacterium]|nr:acetylornithine/succinylornithine family transaminase [Gaiellaceae bacterium]
MSTGPGSTLVHAGLAALRESVLPTYLRADLTIVRGEGCRVWDDGGRSYLDFGTGLAVVPLGHCEPRVTAAAHAQLDRLWHISNLYWTEPMLRLAGLLTERLGGGQAFFCNSGAEANEAALKYARKATGRTRIVALEGGFHGRTMGALAATGQPAKWEGFGPLVPGVSFAPPNDVEALERVLSPGSDVAVVLLEPVLGEGGVIPLTPEFARAAGEIAREVGALLCVDEVQTGTGRSGSFFAFEQLALEPDLVTLAKGLANGLPIGALLVSPRAAGGIGPGDHGSTFGGNPVTCAAACAVVEAIDDELLANVRERAAQLQAGIARMAGVVEVRGLGLLLGVRLDRSVAPVVDACRAQGLLVLSAGEDVLRLAPPLVVTADEVTEALGIVAGALSTT